MNITIEKVGRRHYIVGNTYPIKDQLRQKGCKWDPERKQWFTGKADLAAKLDGATVGESKSSDSNREKPSDDSIVVGRAKYKGKTYLVAGKITERARSPWERDQADAIESRTGKYLLFARNGAFQFWAPTSMVSVEKWYDRPQTIGGLKRFAEERKQRDENNHDTWSYQEKRQYLDALDQMDRFQECEQLAAKWGIRDY